MKNKRKKNKKRLVIFLSFLCVFTFLFKNKIAILKAKKEQNFEPVIKIADKIFANEDAKLIKMEENINLPEVKGNIPYVFNKKIASLYPCIEIIKVISKNYPEFLDSIKFIKITNYEITFKNKKSAILGLGNYEEKLKFLFENYKNFKKRIDLKILSFKKRRF